MGDIGRFALLFRTLNRISPMFAMSDETSACEEEGRTHLNRGRQLSQVLIGSSSQLRLHIEQIRSLICRRVTLSPPCCCGFCSDNVHWHVSIGDRTLDIGKVFDEHVRLEACRTHSPEFGANTTHRPQRHIFAFTHSSAQSLFFLRGSRPSGYKERQRFSFKSLCL